MYNYEVVTVVLNVTVVEKKAMPFNAGFWNKVFSFCLRIALVEVKL